MADGYDTGPYDAEGMLLQRDYLQLDIMVVNWDQHDEPRNEQFWVDTATGIMVADRATFEAWITKVSGAPD